MDLNTPPPGADRAPELLPAVLRPAIARPPASRPTGALGAMLHGSRSWDTVQTPVSRTVSVASCLTLCLYVIAFFVKIAFVDETGLFASVVTWQHNPFWPLFLAAFSTILMVTIAANTRGLARRRLDVVEGVGRRGDRLARGGRRNAHRIDRTARVGGDRDRPAARILMAALD
jgi:hypothetical protein